jgi:glutaminyl-peptide cyclotransferase
MGNILAASLALLLSGLCSAGGDGKVRSQRATAVQGTAPDIPYTVVGTFDHDPNAFTQGLHFKGERLFESTGLNGQSTLRRVDLETGEVLRSRALADEFFGEGSVILGGKLYWLTWQSERAFVYRPRDFKRIGQFKYPGEGWGLTTDGESLVMSNGSARLRWRTETFKVEKSVRVLDGTTPIQNLNELEWIDGVIFANVWQTNRIARIDPATGLVTGWIDLTPLQEAEQAAGDPDVPNGIAYMKSEDRMFVTGKLWAHVYEIELTE